MALHLGDFSGNQGSPKDDEGKEVIRQFAALKRHRREQFYCLAGNHDASWADEPTQWWFRKWVDPTGENPEFSGVDARRRPYPVITFTWDTTNASIGRHTLKVEIPPVPGEQNTVDNIKTVTIEVKGPSK